MTGGLLQLVTTGNQDILLTKKPEFTFFKLIYHRYTNFSKFNDIIVLEKNVMFGSTNKIQIPKNGDLLDNLCMSVDLPELNVIYERELYEEIYYQIGDIKCISLNEKLNLIDSLSNIINYIDKKQYYQAFTRFTDSGTSTQADAMMAGIININNMINSNLSLETNVNTYYLLTDEILNSYLTDSKIFINFGYSTSLELPKTENIIKMNFDTINEKYYTELILNLFYNNNISPLINYLYLKKNVYNINTPNRYVKKLFNEVLDYWTSNNYNLLSYYLLSSTTLIEKTDSTTSELDTLNILQTDLIEINYDNNNISESNKASSYNIIFLLNSSTFNLKNIISVFEKQQITSTINEDVLYKLKSNSTTNFPSGNYCLSNYLNIGTLWPDPKTIYTITSTTLKTNSNAVYQIILNQITNLENKQVIFGFNNNTSTISSNPDFLFYIQNINTGTTNMIEGILFDNKMHAYNINKNNENTNDYNSYEKTYLSNSFITITPNDYNIFYSDIWNNFQFINSSSNNIINSLSQTEFYNNIITYSKSCLSIQRQILINFVNILFTDAIYTSINFNVNQSTQVVDNYYETGLYSTYDTFIKKFLYKDATNDTTYTSSTDDSPEFIYNKFLYKIVNYFITSENNVKSLYNGYGNIFFGGMSTTTYLLTLNNIIKYYNDTKPYVTILLNSSSYNDTTSVAVDDVLYLYNANSINSANLIGVFKIVEIDSHNVFKIRLTFEDYNTDTTGLNFSVAKIDSISDNAYFFKDNNAAKYIQINGNIKDETKYTIKIVNTTNKYVDYTSSSTGAVTGDDIAINKYIWIYSSSSTNYYSSTVTYLGKVSLSKVNPDNNTSDSDREYVFFIDSIEDPNINFDTSVYTYFGFCQNADNTAADISKGFRISSITIKDRYYSSNAINNITTSDTEYRGYKFTNILYLYYFAYLYDQLKTTTTAYNKILLGRLFLISNKIYQIIKLNSVYTASLETLTNTVKLTYYSDFTKIFNSNTILNEFLLKEIANISAYYSQIRTYMNNKSFIKIINNENITTSYTYDGTDLTKSVTNSSDTTVSDANLLTELKTYFANKLSELSDSNYSSIVSAQTIDKKLYYISANDYLSEIYINIINNIYYDDLIDKKSRSIGYLFYDHVNDANSINETTIRNIIETEVVTYDSIHNLSDRDSYIDKINIRYNKSGVSTSYQQLFENYLNHENYINGISNIDFSEDLSVSDSSIKSNIYTKLGVAEGASTGLTTSINKIFVQDETDKSIYSFIETTIQNSNEIYDFLHKFIFTVSIKQIYTNLSSYLRTWEINEIINTNSITLTTINSFLKNNNFEEYVEFSYKNIAGTTKTIFIPTSYVTDFTEKIKYILSLTSAQRTIEVNLSVKEISGMYFKIKEYYFTTGTTYKSVKSLETSLNGAGGYFNGSGYKLIRGCVVTDAEYTSLNYNILQLLVTEINDYGGIKTILVPFDIDSIFCSTTDATSEITLTLDNPKLGIQSNNRPEPGSNTLTVTSKSYNHTIYIKAGLNIKNMTLMGKGDIGISINGVILRNVYALQSPATTTTAPQSIYNITLDSKYYYDFDNDSVTNKLISTGDKIKLYKTGIIDTTIIEITVISFSNNILNFKTNYNSDIKENIYGFRIDESTTNPDSSYGIKFKSISVESFRLNLLSYFSEFTNKETSYHSAIDSDNSFNYYSGKFMNALSSIVNSYLDASNFGGNKLRHTDGHSKILGIAYDGYPIYGPYGYTKPLTSGDVELMQSSYKIKSEFTDNRNDIITIGGGAITAFDSGTIIEDYEYNEGLGSLNECNGRYCVTPEFPNGTFAYFLTFDNETDWNPVYPYIIGNKFYSKNNIASSSTISNINITSNNNLSDYSNDDDVNFIGENGKYGKGIVKTNTNNLKYISISASGIHYSKSSKIHLFKDIPSTLEYVDEHKLYLRRKTRLYGGYYFDISGDQISITKPVDITNQTKFTASLQKINDILIDLKNLLTDNTTPDLDILTLYDTDKYEDILDILGSENCISVLASLSPIFFGTKLKELLYNQINVDTYDFNEIINNYIGSLFTKYKSEYKLYYTEDIYIVKDCTLKNIDIVKYTDNSMITTYNDEIKDIFNNEISAIKTNFSNYSTFKLTKTTVLNRSSIPKFSWINNLGNFIFDNVEIYFNDLLIDKTYSDWVNIWYELNNDYNKKELLEKMIGATKDLMTLNTTTKPKKKLIIPLHFWFCRYSGLNIPLIAMPHVNIYLKFYIASTDDIVRKDIGTKVKLGSDLNMKLITNYIYLDEDERKTFAEARHEYLIEQVQFNGIKNVNSINPKIDIYFRNNIKDIFWILLNNDNLYNKDKGNYSLNNEDNSTNPIKQTKILLNNVKLVDLDGSYTNYVIPYERYVSTPSDGINVYSFNLNNYVYQPSGSLNFSMLDKIEMDITLDSSLESVANKKLLVFGNSYNILRIMSGLAGLAFIE